MGIFSFLTGGVRLASTQAAPMLASPLATDTALEQAIVGDFFGALPAEVIDRNTANRVPELKRALVAHQSLVAPLRFEKYVSGSDVRADDQPHWVANCTYLGISRYIAVKQLITELFWEGIGVIGCWLDTEGNVYDWITIPRSMWHVDPDSQTVVIAEEIPAQFRQRAVLVPLGNRGVLADGIDSIRQARALELARQARLSAPPAATELHVTDQAYDNMTRAEQTAVIEDYKAGRNKHSVSITPSYLEVKERGISGQLDLFESAKNSLRLELAMHAGVPGSFVNGAKEGGAGGDMNYQNAGGEQSELWTFGSAEYAYAIAAALSTDEVVGAGAEVRADASAFAVPAPLSIDPEAGDTPGNGGIPA